MSLSPAQGRAEASCRTSYQKRKQISPIGISAFDQFELPFTVPAFHPLLVRDAIFNPVTALCPHQPVQFVLRAIVRTRPHTVLMYPPGKIGRYAHIHGAAIMVSHDINPATALFLIHRWMGKEASARVKPGPTWRCGGFGRINRYKHPTAQTSVHSTPPNLVGPGLTRAEAFGFCYELITSEILASDYNLH